MGLTLAIIHLVILLLGIVRELRQRLTWIPVQIEQNLALRLRKRRWIQRRIRKKKVDGLHASSNKSLISSRMNDKNFSG